MITSCDAMQWSDQFMCELYVWFLILFWSFLLVCLLTAAGNHWGHRCHLCKQSGRRLGSEQRLPSGRWRWGALSSTSWSTGSGFQNQTKSVVKHYCSWLGYYFLFWLDRYVYVVGEVGRWLTGQVDGNGKGFSCCCPSQVCGFEAKINCPWRTDHSKSMLPRWNPKVQRKENPPQTFLQLREEHVPDHDLRLIEGLYWDIGVCETSTNGFTTSFEAKGEEDENWKCSHENSKRKNYGK